MDGLAVLSKKILTCSCPKCGNGKIFSKYLTLKSQCDQCSESFTELKADDGPAWITMMIVGKIMVGIMLYYELSYDLSFWMSATLWPISFCLVAMIFLPFAKAFFVNMIWRSKQED